MDLFDIDDRAHRNGTAAGAVSILNTLGAQNGGTGGEVRSLNTFHKSTQKLFIRSIRVLEEPFHTCGNFTQVMWGNIGCHTHGDTRRPVDQQVRDARRQYRGLKRFTVIVRLKINGIFINVTHHFQGDRCHLRLGITRSRSAVITGGPEVTLTERQRIAHNPALDQAYKGIVNGAVAVGVELTHHIAHHASALIEGTIGSIPTVIHRVDYTTMHRLESITHIGQGATDNNRHCIVQVGTLHLGLQIYLFNMTVGIVKHNLTTICGDLDIWVFALVFFTHEFFRSSVTLSLIFRLGNIANWLYAKLFRYRGIECLWRSAE